MRFLIYLSLCLTCQLLLSEENPVPRLEHTMNAALDLIFLPEHSDKVAVRADLVRAIVEEQFDLGVLIRRTFGRHWQRLDEVNRSCIGASEAITGVCICGRDGG